MTPQQRAYQRFWEVMTRRRNCFLSELGRAYAYCVLAAGVCLAGLYGHGPYPKPKVYITQEFQIEFWKGLAKRKQAQLDAPIHPWQIAFTEEQRKQITEDLKKRMAMIEDGKGF